ncbi:MAG TPA: GNAT family N-acetyltransferase [Ktedonobacterales bacterium]
MAFDIHPLRAWEVARSEADLPYHSHEQWLDWLLRQERGAITLFIAWRDGIAVGHAMLAWNPRGDIYVERAGCPWIYDVLTHPDFRSRGIGTALLRACEAAAIARGQPIIGIGVSITNTRARNLYERLGYADTGLGSQITSGFSTGPDGITHMWEEQVQYLTKTLIPTP